uniref:TOG domain-containing protein n=1 Tax=Alexandrium monilatum TaxID=311494 RepID=A0A7S4UUE0_9DINO
MLAHGALATGALANGAPILKSLGKNSEEALIERQRLLAKLRGLLAEGRSAAAYKGLAGEAANCLSHPHGQVRATACSVLAEMGEAGAPYVAELLKRFDIQERDPEVQKQAMRALGACGGDLTSLQEVTALLEVEVKKPEMQVATLRAMAELGLAESFSETIVTFAKGPRTHVRMAALTALGTLGAEAAAHVDLIAGRVAEPVMRTEALQILGRLGEPAAKYLPQVADCLRDSDPSSREAAAEALKSLGRFAGAEHEKTVQKVLKLLDLPDDGAKAAGITALGCLGAQLAGGYAHRIAGILTCVAPEPVVARVEKEERLPPPYSPFELRCLAKCAKYGVSQTAEQQPAPLEPPRPAARPPPALPSFLRKPNCAAALALARLGKQGQSYIGTIAKMAAAADVELRLACVKALGEMDGRGQVQAEMILNRFVDKEPAVRAAALAALSRLASRGVELDELVVKKMNSMLVDPDDGVRCAAALAVVEVGGPYAFLGSSKVLPLLKRPQEEAVVVGLKVLGTLGSRGAVVICLTVSGIDYTFLRSSKDMTKAFGDAVKEVISAEAQGADVCSESSSAGASSVNVKAVIVQPSTDAASALEGKLDAARLGEALDRKIGSVDSIARAIIREQLRVGDVTIACQPAVHAEAVGGLMEDPRPSVRAASLRSLGAMGGGSPQVAGGLAGRASGRLQDGVCEVRAAAAFALARMGQAGPAHAPEVARLLKDPLPEVGRAACEALGRMGASEKLPSDVLNSLEAATKDSTFRSVTAAAAEAMKLVKR